MKSLLISFILIFSVQTTSAQNVEKSSQYKDSTYFMKLGLVSYLVLLKETSEAKIIKKLAAASESKRTEKILNNSDSIFHKYGDLKLHIDMLILQLSVDGINDNKPRIYRRLNKHIKGEKILPSTSPYRVLFTLIETRFNSLHNIPEEAKLVEVVAAALTALKSGFDIYNGIEELKRAKVTALNDLLNKLKLRSVLELKNSLKPGKEKP